MNHPALKSTITQQIYTKIRSTLSCEGVSPQALIEILSIALEDEGHTELAANLADLYAHRDTNILNLSGPHPFGIAAL
jgi:hypothetical protein